MATLNDPITNTGANIDGNGSLHTGLYDSSGNPIFKLLNGAYATTDRIMPMGGLSDNVWRGLRTDKLGGLASASFTPLIDYTIEATNVPSNFATTTTTMTVTTALASGTLLNASAIGTSSTYACVASFKAVPKDQRTPLHLRVRAQIILGGTNGSAEIGFSNTSTPAGSALPYGFYFLYNGTTLKPAYAFNSSNTLGTDFSASISSSKYYIWDIFIDDNYARYIVSDPNTQSIITDQTIQINTTDPRMGESTHWFTYFRTYVGASANVGTATQMYVADAMVGFLDYIPSKPYPHIQAGNMLNSLISPIASLSQNANYTNSTVPTSATLSNTAAGYTTLGGQFQFATVAGAETDYCLFGWQCPAPYSFYCTGIEIDSINTGAAVATTATTLIWGIAGNSTAVTLASNTYRMGLGAQSWIVGAAIGQQAQQIMNKFNTPIVTDAGRYMQIFFKTPIGTATASQIIRGVVMVEGYFE